MSRYAVALPALVALALAGCGGANDSPGVPASTSAQTTTTTATTTTTTGGTADATKKRVPTVGDSLKSGTVTYKLSSVRRTQSAAGLQPQDGAEFLLVRVRWTNRGQEPTSLFCIGPAAALIAEGGAKYTPNTEAIMSLPGGEACDDLQPGLARTDAVLFEIPRGARLNNVAFWDPSADDVQGTLVQFGIPRA